MKKRLRRKLRLAEFQELGFEISVRFKPGLDDDGIQGFFDRLVDAVEERDLVVIGSTEENGFSGNVLRNGRGSTVEADREHLKKMLDADPATTEQTVGPLMDAWHGPNMPIRRSK